MSITESGRYAEKEAHDFLKTIGYQIFQADWIAQGKDGQYYLFEVKHQEIFEPPPFHGHGLPYHQVISRLNFQKKTGVIAMLLILDKTTNIWYYQRLDSLEAGEYIDTNGIRPRRIYNINNFEQQRPPSLMEIK